MKVFLFKLKPEGYRQQMGKKVINDAKILKTFGCTVKANTQKLPKASDNNKNTKGGARRRYGSSLRGCDHAQKRPTVLSSFGKFS